MIDPESIKAESIAKLRQWGIPYIEHLPTLEEVSELSPQTVAAVARRAMVVSHIIVIGYGGSASELMNAIKEFGLVSHASAHELDMLGRKKHTKQERIDATWMTECMQSFAWCLGLADLDHRKFCDDDLVDRFPAPYEDPSAFIASATLRPFEEIYRQADLHYRLHWAARGARDATLSESLIRERRKALDWVIGVGTDWDEVPDDT